MAPIEEERLREMEDEADRAVTSGRLAVRHIPNQRQRDNTKPLMLVIEGPNGSGKTTLERALLQALDHKVTVKVRYTGSNWVYGQIYGRNPVDVNAEMELFQRSFNIVEVILLCPSLTCHARMTSRGLREAEHATMADLGRQVSLFHSYVGTTLVSWDRIAVEGRSEAWDNCTASELAATIKALLIRDRRLPDRSPVAQALAAYQRLVDLVESTARRARTGRSNVVYTARQAHFRVLEALGFSSMEASRRADLLKGASTPHLLHAQLVQDAAPLVYQLKDALQERQVKANITKLPS